MCLLLPMQHLSRFNFVLLSLRRSVLLYGTYCIKSDESHASPLMEGRKGADCKCHSETEDFNLEAKQWLMGFYIELYLLMHTLLLCSLRHVPSEILL